ncbi:hypothetical protein [Pseudonocardia sp. ICBG601]
MVELDLAAQPRRHRHRPLRLVRTEVGVRSSSEIRFRPTRACW